MTDELRLGTLGDAVLQGGISIPTPLRTGATIPIPLQGGITIPTPLAGDGMTVPIPAFAAGDDLPSPPHPFVGDELVMLHSGATIPIP